MSDLEAIAHRVEIEALRGEFTDAMMMRDYDRLVSLFTRDGAAWVPYIDAEAVSREEIRAGIERLQPAHPRRLEVHGLSAPGRFRHRFGESVPASPAGEG
jgi:ketosteroid isomerase-like protein